MWSPACTDDPEPEPDESELDAARPAAPVPTGSLDASFRPLRPPPDGGLPDGWVPDLDLPLEAFIQVNGRDLPCGACSVLAVQAQGGRRPYTYTWSDPSLEGPGPHMVCPTEPTTYTVQISDESATVGEFSVPAMTTSVSAAVECVADAGVPLDHVGCVSGSSFNEPKPGAMVQCEGSPDGGVLTEQGLMAVQSFSGPVPLHIVPGETYEFIYDHLIPLVVGQGVTVDVYGAMNDAPCEKLEKLFTFRLDGTWHQSVCFTPQRSYDRTITHISVDGVWFWFELGQIGTTCRGCSLQ